MSKSTVDSVMAPTLLLLLVSIQQTVTLGLAASTPSSSSSLLSTATTTVHCLQTPHPDKSPTDCLTDLASKCDGLGVHEFDVYGDFQSGTETIEKENDETRFVSIWKDYCMCLIPLSTNCVRERETDRELTMCVCVCVFVSFLFLPNHDTDTQSSFLRRFEKEIADELGMEDAVFMPSGVMAQGIALLIHARQGKGNEAGNIKRHFLCHHTSHLLLHEDEAYEELLQMEPIVVSTLENVEENEFGVPPMMYDNVKESLEGWRRDKSKNVNIIAREKESIIQEKDNDVAALIVELPHREVGGKCTPWDDILAMQILCAQNGIRFHCDGARLFEATAGYDKTPAQLAEPFDSVYVSFYKGLGGIAGAMLLGDAEFCTEARKWLRRFGGNLYTLLPYVVSGWSGYRSNWVGPRETKDGQDNLSFVAKRDKLRTIVATLSNDDGVSEVVSFDPAVPQVNMVHGYLKHDADAINRALEEVQAETGIRVLRRVRPVDPALPAFQAGFVSKFELSIGARNGSIHNDIFVDGWKALAKKLQ